MGELERTTTAAVTRVQIARYAGAVGDFNPVHVDEEFAKAAGLPSQIAHGPLTLSLVIDALGAQFGSDALRGVDAETGRRLERIGQSVLKVTDDHREGARAFLEKRPPEWTAR